MNTPSPSPFALQRIEKNLEEVIVTGYSTQNKKFIAGSVQTINSQAIRDLPAAGFNQLLQGKATGVQVTANSESL